MFIGMDIDVDLITKELDDCLLSPSEYDAKWDELPDPFSWTINS
ncbi:hypothetical protein H9655_04610 [Cytobacillus sp. Sa5YUA1]|uniref:Uncharacterized protein n=1 Tax=Cytobacillus stercorigallinarum TaxID=2762240 RepID=A0ABR8QLB1_9BACI|nr:hypothetical protein [Cytobacillus stercorigallinarum]